MLVQAGLVRDKLITDFSPKGLLVPVLTSTVFACAQILRKQGLALCNQPLFGGAWGYSVALLISFVAVMFYGKDFDSRH